MKVTVPLFFVYHSKIGGAEQAIYNLIEGLLKLKIEVTIAYVLGNVSNIFLAKNISNKNLKHVIYKNNFHRLINEQIFAFRRDIKSDCILFPNCFTPLLISKSFGTKIGLIHDLQFLHFPENFTLKKRLVQRLMVFLTLKNSDIVITISDFVNTDIIKYYGEKFKKKIKRVYNSISWERFKSFKKDHNNDSIIYTTLCAHYPHKNIITILKAFELVNKKLPMSKLYLVGQLKNNLTGNVNNSLDLKLIIKKLNLENSVFITGFITDEKLSELLAQTKLFLFPSLFEGFGMPPVEAMGLGIPVLTTKCASIPEVTLRKCHYINDPLNYNEWAMRIQSLTIENSNLKGYYDELSVLIKETYSPINIASSFIEITSNSKHTIDK